MRLILETGNDLELQYDSSVVLSPFPYKHVMNLVSLYARISDIETLQWEPLVLAKLPFWTFLQVE